MLLTVVDAVSLDGAIKAILEADSPQIAWTLPQTLVIETKKPKKRKKKLRSLEKKMREAFSGKTCVQLSLEEVVTVDRDIMEIICSVCKGYSLPEVNPTPTWDLSLLDILLANCLELGTIMPQDNRFLVSRWHQLSQVDIRRMQLSLFDKKLSSFILRMNRVKELELSFMMTGKGVSIPVALKALKGMPLLRKLTLDLTTKTLLSGFFAEYATSESKESASISLNILKQDFNYFGLVGATGRLRNIIRVSWNRSSAKYVSRLSLREKVHFKHFLTSAVRHQENVARLLSFLSRVHSTNHFNILTENKLLQLDFSAFPPFERKKPEKANKATPDSESI